jgi:hypothetical protein
MKFDMGRAWSEAVAMIAGNRELLLVVAGIFFFLPSLLLSMLGPDMATLSAMDPEQAEQMFEAVAALYADAWWLVLIVVVAQLIGYIALLALLRDDAHPTVGDAIRTGLKGMLPSLATYLVFVLGCSLALTLLVGLATLTGVVALTGVAMLIGLVGMIYLAVKASLSAPVIAIERMFNPLAVLARSWRLTKGNSLRLFAFYLLLTVVYVVISMVLGFVLMGLVALLGDSGGRIVSGLVSGLIGAIATVVFVAVLAAVHRQLAGPSVAGISETFE